VTTVKKATGTKEPEKTGFFNFGSEKAPAKKEPEKGGFFSFGNSA
jgi:hypothetical protein